jgi:hypothetical protein
MGGIGEIAMKKVNCGENHTQLEGSPLDVLRFEVAPSQND